jgi:hypothetical protein
MFIRVTILCNFDIQVQFCHSILFTSHCRNSNNTMPNLNNQFKIKNMTIKLTQKSGQSHMLEGTMSGRRFQQENLRSLSRI